MKNNSAKVTKVLEYGVEMKVSLSACKVVTILDALQSHRGTLAKEIEGIIIDALDGNEKTKHYYAAEIASFRARDR